ncbi:MAG TPA: hypothetical protein VMV94_05065, partial [Phycisphaerae bacterium]|nr:hypothetical protein [Phycisphaerae bacterium]
MDISFGASGASAGNGVRYVVFEEERTISGGVEGPFAVRLNGAQIYVPAEPTFEYNLTRAVATMSYNKAIPIGSRWVEPERRLTVLCPGFIMETFFPRTGEYSIPLTMRPVSRQWEGPARLAPGLVRPPGGGTHRDQRLLPLCEEKLAD